MCSELRCHPFSRHQACEWTYADLPNIFHESQRGQPRHQLIDDIRQLREPLTEGPCINPVALAPPADDSAGDRPCRANLAQYRDVVFVKMSKDAEQEVGAPSILVSRMLIEAGGDNAGTELYLVVCSAINGDVETMPYQVRSVCIRSRALYTAGILAQVLPDLSQKVFLSLALDPGNNGPQVASRSTRQFRITAEGSS